MKNKRVILLAISVIVLTCGIVLTLIDYPHGAKPYYPYVSACLYLVLCVFNMYEGRQKMQMARNKGEKVTWYRQNMITLGLMFLMLGLFEVIGPGIGNKLPEAQQVILLYITSILFGVPFLILCVLSFRAILAEAEQRKLHDQQEQKEMIANK